MEQRVRLEVSGGVGTVRIDHPPMNVLDSVTLAALAAVARETDARTDVEAVVLAGLPRALAAGADVEELAAATPEAMSVGAALLQDRIGALAGVGKPTVAAVTGYALGGGLEIALACDLRVAGRSAVLGLPEIQLGLIPGGGGTQRLARLVGPARAKELVMTGRRFGADEALALGVVDRVVADDEVEAVARELAARFVGGPAVALRAAKRAVDAAVASDPATGLATERHLFASLFATRDRAAGTASFLARGPGRARFTGR